MFIVHYVALIINLSNQDNLKVKWIDGPIYPISPLQKCSKENIKDKSCHLKNNSRYLRNDPRNIFTELKKSVWSNFSYRSSRFFLSKEKSYSFIHPYLMNSVSCFVDWLGCHLFYLYIWQNENTFFHYPFCKTDLKQPFGTNTEKLQFSVK